MAAPMSLVWTWQFQMPVAADDDDRVADRAPALLEVLDPVVGEVAEEHHLVPLSPAASPPARRRSRPGAGDRSPPERLGQRLAVDHVQGGVEEQQVPGAAGVDHAGVLQHRQQVRRPRPARSGRRRGRRARRRRARPRRRPPPARRVGALAHHGEDRALDRREHGLVGGVGGDPQRLGDRGAGRPRRRLEVEAMPRRIWERITPLLPRAPISEPWLIASHVGDQLVRRRLASRRRRRRACAPCWCRCRRRAPGTR